MNCVARAEFFYARLLANLFVLLLLVVACVSVVCSPPARGQELQTPRQEDLRLLEVWADGELLTDEPLSAYQRRDGVLVPLVALAQLLELALAATPERGIIEGFILSEDRRFRLDVARLEVSLAGAVKRYDPQWVEQHRDDVYVDTRLVSQWLPVDLYIDLGRSRLDVRSREPLPRKFRAARERRRDALRGPATADYPIYRYDYRLITPPFIDQTVELRQREGADGQVHRESHYTTYATADFLFMESAWYFSGGNETPEDFRVTLGRRDPDRQLLGPLGASEFAFGHISYPSMSLIARTLPPEPGFAISSYPLLQQTQFDRHSFRGDLPPRWEVELYHNNVLLDIRRPGAEGQYQFDDVPLLFGMNYFRLVFYGPQGQRREEEYRFLLGETLTPPGKHYYRVAANRDDDGNERAVAQTDIGLHRHLSLAAGYAKLPVGGVEHQYGKLGIRTSWRNLFLYGDSVVDDQDGLATEIGLRTRIANIGLGLSRVTLSDYVSEEFPLASDPVHTRDRVRLDTVIPLGFSVRLPFAVDVTRDRMVSGEVRTEVQQRLSAFVLGTALTNTLRWDTRTDQQTIAEGNFQFSHRLGRYGLRGELFYAVQPESAIRSTDLRFEGPLTKDYHYRLGFNRVFDPEQNRYSIAINKQAGRFALGIEASRTSDGETALGMILFAGLGYEPRAPRWESKARPTAGHGAISALVFNDINQNGIRDTQENVIEGAGFTINGSRHPAITNTDGIAYIDNLPQYQYIDIGMALDSIEDPSLIPVRNGVRVLARPGRTVEVDFPVIATGEIDGVLRVLTDGRLREIAGVEVQLLDVAGHVIKVTHTAYDGYFYLPQVTPGDYGLRIAPHDAARFRLVSGTKLVRLKSAGTLIETVDLVARQSHHPSSAAATRAPTPAPAVAASRSSVTYTVKEGDWLWQISRRFYGTPNEAKRILEANRDTIGDPNVLQPGQKLVIPPLPDATLDKSDLTPASQVHDQPLIYTVKEGDWLWQISRRFYGNTTEVGRILQANRKSITDPDILRPGQKLIIPPGTGFVDLRGGEWIWEIVSGHPTVRTPIRHLE